MISWRPATAVRLPDDQQSRWADGETVVHWEIVTAHCFLRSIRVDRIRKTSVQNWILFSLTHRADWLVTFVKYSADCNTKPSVYTFEEYLWSNIFNRIRHKMHPDWDISSKFENANNKHNSSPWFLALTWPKSHGWRKAVLRIHSNCQGNQSSMILKLQFQWQWDDCKSEG